jgi:hypothetical protein
LCCAAKKAKKASPNGSNKSPKDNQREKTIVRKPECSGGPQKAPFLGRFLVIFGKVKELIIYFISFVYTFCRVDKFIQALIRCRILKERYDHWKGQSVCLLKHNVFETAAKVRTTQKRIVQFAKNAYEIKLISLNVEFKGTESRDFRPSVFS